MVNGEKQEKSEKFLSLSTVTMTVRRKSGGKILSEKNSWESHIGFT